MKWPQHDPAIEKPKLRGVSHAIGAVVALPAMIWLYSEAQSLSGQVGVLIYALSLVGLLSVSAIYHTFRWSEVMRLHMRRLDRSMIFVLTAGTQTPFLLVFEEQVSSWLAPAVWAGAFAGLLMSTLWPRAPRWVATMAYILLSFLCFPLLPVLYTEIGILPIALILGGGVLYIIGAFAYVFERPNPFPDTFGYHEIFHVLVLAAAACHFIAVHSGIV